MKCEKVMDEVLRSDSENLSYRVRFHILFCRSCRNEISQLAEKIREAGTVAPFRAPEGLSDQIMRTISLLEVEYDHRVSQGKWIAVGLVLFASIMLLPYSDSFSWLSAYFGGSFDIPLSIVLGVLITGYSAVLIGSQLDYLGKIRFVKGLFR